MTECTMKSCRYAAGLHRRGVQTVALATLIRIGSVMPSCAVRSRW